eukprot:3673465-Pyramimonas_sp.AAC.1
MVEGVVKGLWRGRFLKEVEDMCYNTYPQWKALEGKATPDQAWEALISAIRPLALGYFAQHVHEHDSAYAQARQAQQDLLRERASLRQYIGTLTEEQQQELTSTQQQLFRITRQ